MGIRIDYADYRAIGRRFIAFERERSLLSAAPKNQLTDARTDRIQRDHGRAFWFQICIQRLHEQKFSAMKGLVLYGRNYRTDDASDLHLRCELKTVDDTNDG